MVPMRGISKLKQKGIIAINIRVCFVFNSLFISIKTEMKKKWESIQFSSINWVILSNKLTNFF